MTPPVSVPGRPGHRPRILLAEDHPAMAAELAALLATEYDVVGVVHDGQALIDATRSFRPDCVVSDIAMPCVSGLVAADTLLGDEPGRPFVFVTVLADPSVIRRARGTGALGYVLKCDAGEQLLAAVDAALAGVPFLSAGAQHSLDDHGPDPSGPSRT